MGDVSFDDHRLRVHGKERVLPLPHLLLELLRDYIELERPDRFSTGALFVVLRGVIADSR